MIPIPLMMAIERLDEKLRLLQAFEQRLRVANAEQRVAQVAVHAIDDGARDQKVPHFDRLVAQHRVYEIIRDLPVRSGEPLERLAGACRIARRQQRQFDTRDPSFGAHPNVIGVGRR